MAFCALGFHHSSPKEATMDLNYATQRQYVIQARFGIAADRDAARFAERIERLARHHVVLYSVRNQVRAELKQQGFQIPPRSR
jgi:hypothetical protein